MNRTLAFLLSLALAGCGLRIGTDPQGLANGSPPPHSCIATWSRDVGDSTFVVLRDTFELGWEDPVNLAIPDSTLLAVVSSDEGYGVWLRPGEQAPRLRQVAPLHLKWRDEGLRDGWTFILPGTGTDYDLRIYDTTWNATTIPVFADVWPARITRTFAGRRLVWSIDSARLADSLVFDLSALPDSSCPIQPVPGGSTWECRPR